MLRMIMLIKVGKIIVLIILWRFGIKNWKNKLYFVFCELGWVVRMMFLLEYIIDLELCKMIQVVICKSEEFNEFVCWLFFVNSGKIVFNLKYEQGKIVKFNYLLVNLVIFYNVNVMIIVFNDLCVEGYDIRWEYMVKFLSYYMVYLGWLGSFELDLNKEVKLMWVKLEIE